MIDRPQLDEAFAAALEVIRNCRASGTTCVDGSSAEDNLNRLERELNEERTRAVARGSVDKQWFQKTVRWLVEWVPENDLTLIAALGGIVRANPSVRG
jgi:hypothetical protein